MKIVVFDNEHRWIQHVRDELGDIVATTDQEDVKDADLVIVAPRFLDSIDCDGDIVVATSRPTTNGALKAFRCGAIRYIAKTFGDLEEIHAICSKSQ